MIGAPNFSVFTVQAAASKIRTGVVEALRADRQIAAFLDATYDAGTDTYGTDARIYETATPATPDRPLPQCYVFSVRQGRENQPSGEVNITATVGIALIWDEFRETLESGDNRTSEDFFNRVYAVLAADQRLESVPSGAAAILATGKGLADYMTGAETQEIQQVEGASPDRVTLAQLLYVGYSVLASITTGVPQ